VLYVSRTVRLDENPEAAHRLAYAIFSVYIPLAKKRTRVVTDTKRRPDAKYGWSTTSVSSV
jgi:hypothetical protein